MASGKQINFVVTRKVYEKLLEEKSAGNYETMTELLDEIIRYYFERDKHQQFQKEGVIDFLKSEEGRLWFSALLDEELLRRAMPK